MSSARDVQNNPAAAALRSQLLGVIAQHQRGDVVPAIAGYRAVLAQNARQFDALRLLGVALRSNGEPQAALAVFDQAIAVRDDFAEVWYHRGQALAESGHRAEAIGSLERAVALRPDMVVAWTALGMQRHEVQDFAGAVDACDHAVAIDPRAAAGWNNRGLALVALKRPADALPDYDKALDCEPNRAELWSNRASALDALKRHAEALENIDRALALAPDIAANWSSRAQILAALGDIPAALVACERALDLDPLLAQAWSQRGGAFTELGRYAEASVSLDRARELAPGDPIAAWNRGFLDLLQGRFDTGWEGYENREVISDMIGRYDAPIWDGIVPLAGKTIALHCEQGLGDTLQFCRYALVLADKGARVVLTVPAVLHRLVSSLGGGVRVVTDGDPMPVVDLQCMLMSLPQRLKTDAASIPLRVPYLCPSEGCVQEWQALLTEHSGGEYARRLRIGLVISGTGGVGSMRLRAVALEQLAPLLERLRGLGIELHQMQKDVLPGDEPWLDRLGIVDHRSRLRDFCETAGLAACLDAVISIDTSVAHLAGAMGLPLFLLLPAYPDWRWLLERDDSPWYPSARLFRQHIPGNWSAPLERLEAAVVRFLESPMQSELATSRHAGRALAPHSGSGVAPSDWRDDARLLSLQAAARAAPHDAAAQYNLGLRYLTLGCLDLGWDYFEWRQRVARLYTALPESGAYWDGSADLAGRTILLCHEQGLGDVIQFCRYVPLLAAHGARVLLGVAPALARLMDSLPGVAQVLAGDAPLPPFDLKCPVLSLGQRFGSVLGDIPAGVPYLAPAPDRLAWWQQWLEEEHPTAGALRVGLACSGNPDHPADQQRSIELGLFAALCDAGVQVHVLQNAVRASDEAALRSCGFIDHRERLTDLAETAALCRCLDVVISVDTVVAHLAGALNVPVFVLLAAEPDWRWMLERTDSPWYPSARLFRQLVAGDWSAPVQQVVAAIADLAPRRLARPGMGPTLAPSEAAAWRPLYRSAITPPDLRSFLDAAALQHQQGDRAAAILAYRTVLEYEPAHFNARRLLGTALFQDGKSAEAIAQLDKALALAPDSDEAWLVKSEAHTRLGDYDAALASSERALQLRADKSDIWNQHGVQLYALGRMTEALHSLDRAADLAPDNPDVRVNRGLAHLVTGNFALGWLDYEHRVRMPAMKMDGVAGCPFWQPGQSLAGKTLLLNHEQGLGDTLQFCRFAPRLTELGARVVLGVEAPLKELLGSLDGVACVVSKGDPMPRIDLQCWIMGAPLRLGTTVDTIPSAVPYLQAPENRLAQWRERLPVIARRRIGLAFSGNPEHPNDRFRSISLEALAPWLRSLAQTGIEWHLVQRDVRASDEALIAPLGIVDHRRALTDFCDTAALMQCLDGVVSVDTSTAHLAGALGIPLFLLLPGSTDWRWMVDRTDSPWYPTARLFRQVRLGHWDAPLDRLRLALSGA
jgi:tetratricopeptide (TPR) repeat protein